MNDPNPTYKILNNQTYYMQIRLHNPDGDELILNPEAILQLVIEDDIHFWPIRGFLIYENPFEIMERKFMDSDILKTESDNNFAHIVQNTKLYNFRNDGKDFLDVMIYPMVDGSTTLSLKDLPKEKWEMKYRCVIYDKEDIEVGNITQKLKKLYFWDIDYQKMLDKRIQWSTATSDQNPIKRKLSTYDPSQATDNERKMLTGDAIKDILVTNNFTVEDKLFNKGYTNILYSAFHDKNIWENIEYLLANHISAKTNGVNSTPSDTTDICIFQKDRFTQKFQLEPLYQIFSKAGYEPNNPKEYQIEHLFFEETVGGTTTSPNKAPILDKVSTDIDVKLMKIKKYQYVDMSSCDSSRTLVTTPVHSYDFKTKTFSINMADSNMTNLENKIKDSYISRKLLSQNGPHPLLTLNKDKINNQVIDPVYSIRSDKASITKKGLGKMLYSSLFLNNCLVFDVDGATIRQAGKFIGLDRVTYSDNNFDYKLCGQWFITKVKHIFFHHMYVTQITCVKLHSYNNLNIKTDV